MNRGMIFYYRFKYYSLDSTMADNYGSDDDYGNNIDDDVVE
jgi:hypothetical protein